VLHVLYDGRQLRRQSAIQIVNQFLTRHYRLQTEFCGLPRTPMGGYYASPSPPSTLNISTINFEIRFQFR
jgi:hypothetical protein